MPAKVGVGTPQPAVATCDSNNLDERRPPLFGAPQALRAQGGARGRALASFVTPSAELSNCTEEKLWRGNKYTGNPFRVQDDHKGLPLAFLLLVHVICLVAHGEFWGGQGVSHVGQSHAGPTIWGTQG